MKENKLTLDYSTYRDEFFKDPEFAAAMKELQLKLDLGHAIINARIERGMSQTTLAKAIGTQQANISRIEAGLGNPTIELIQRLINFLELEVKITAKMIADNGIPLVRRKYSDRFDLYPFNAHMDRTRQHDP